MIYLVIGPSCAGKTQFVSNSWMTDDCTVKKDLIKYTECKDAYLIGDYTINAKVRGTDKVARQHYKLIAPQIIKLHNLNDKDIIAEGINLCWHFVATDLLEVADDVKLIYLQSSLEKSIERNAQLHNTQTITNIKSTYTRTLNWFNKYAGYFDSYIVNTDVGVDFSNFSINTAKLEKYTPQTAHLF